MYAHCIQAETYKLVREESKRKKNEKESKKIRKKREEKKNVQQTKPAYEGVTIEGESKAINQLDRHRWWTISCTQDISLSLEFFSFTISLLVGETKTPLMDEG